ncbi:hypothetical protein [Algoriphagus confluentis]|uniref:Curlin associated repeat-containing protein n=1 Tax=Algoriphagus confluentis TaxID=1697556 RepID=A0ABQ6PUE5_9BACT|nr:hypothetical protein Aconfl_42030 [Algoriphagus confluentis]
MKLNCLTLAFFASFLIPFSLMGQELESERNLRLVTNQIISTNGVITGNEALVRQIGDNNDSRVFQQGQNMASITQEGLQNTGYVEQVGSQNQASLRQTGTWNEVSLWAIGQNISINSTQEGRGNVINAYLEYAGVSGRSANLVQLGNGNRIDIALLGNGFVSSGPQSAEVRQVGNQHTLEAFIDPFSGPISVTQNPGVNGAGMSLSISTSAFNFPLRR